MIDINDVLTSFYKKKNSIKNNLISWYRLDLNRKAYFCYLCEELVSDDFIIKYPSRHTEEHFALIKNHCLQHLKEYGLLNFI